MRCGPTLTMVTAIKQGLARFDIEGMAGSQNTYSVAAQNKRMIEIIFQGYYPFCYLISGRFHKQGYEE